MGQKTNPIGNILVIIKTWDSRWYLKNGYAAQLHEDLYIKDFIKKKLYHAGISKIEIERAGLKIRIIVYTARPGIIIGKKGTEVEGLKKQIEVYIGKQINIDIKEVRKPELDSVLVAEHIAMEIEKRVAFRRAMKKAVLSSIRFGALGIKVMCAGRLAGAEIARSEWYREGRVPLHTFRADIDYGFAEAKTTFGLIGVKVWIYKGDILPDGKKVA
ncbi:MAG: 30S ribosomal protein S3 [Nitrospirae bacterium]|nr:30S ribosomal protein S3 [Nitrospirota bacterium]